jgi:hypothetical protein
MKKKAFALRMDEDLFKAIEAWAKEEYRSVNGQIEWMLYKSLRDSRRLSRDEEKG